MIHSQPAPITSVGIDPGFNGAIVGLDQRAQVLFKWKMPLIRGTKKVNMTEVSNLLSYLQHRHSLIVGLEENHAFPEQSMRTADAMAWNIAPIYGMLVHGQIRHRLLKPKIWQAPFHKGVRKLPLPKNSSKLKKSKLKSLQAARQIWPWENFLPDGQTQGQPEDGIFDALLMAEFVRREFLGGRSL